MAQSPPLGDLQKAFDEYFGPRQAAPALDLSRHLRAQLAEKVALVERAMPEIKRERRSTPPEFQVAGAELTEVFHPTTPKLPS